jgi:glycosyltransferase involved in cell wall biosynthesis
VAVKMRVLHAYKIYWPDGYGGIPEVISVLGRLDGTERRVLVARSFGLRRSFRDGTDDITAVGSLGTLFSTPVSPSYPLVFARQANEVDLVVQHAPFPLADIGLLFGLPSTTALVVHWHAEMVGRPFLARLIGPLIRRTLERADRIVVSDPVMAEGSPLLAPYAQKCVVVPYGCDVDYWHALDPTGFEAVQRIKARFPRLIVAVGRLVGYKGFDILLQAMRSVDAHAIIIGDGPLRGKLEALATELGVTGNVSFVGSLPRDQVKEHFHAADVFAFPSVNNAEAFGLSQVEAMAAGLPIVNTTLGTAVPRVARDGLEALSVPPGDPQALASALRTLITDRQFAGRLGAAGSQRAHAEFEQSRFLARMENVYQEAVGRRMKT